MAETTTFDMFEPEIFLATVQAMEPARGLKLYNQVRKDTTVFPYVQWKTKYGQFSTLAEYNAPNSKANIAPRQPVKESVKNAQLAYMREGDYFTPTATLLIKDIESGNDAAIKPAEQIIADQVANVNSRIDNRIEWSLWQALQGGFDYSGPNTGSFTVDYGFQPTHKITLNATDQWDDADGTGPTVDSIISTIRSFKQLIQKDGGVPVTDVFLTQATMDLLIAAWTDASVSDANRAFLTDTQIQQYYATGELRGFMGVESWTTVEQYFDDLQADGSVIVRPYVPHGTLLVNNMTANNPLRYTSGPTADFDAPRGHIGRYAKNWTEKDPSGRSFLIEESGLPVLDRPDQFATVKVASDTWIGNQSW